MSRHEIFMLSTRFHCTILLPLCHLITMRVLVLLSLLVASACAFVPAPAFSRVLSSLAVAIDTSDIKNGMTLEIDNEPHKVLSFSIMKQARGAAKTTIKFKNLMRGNTIENTYRSGEKFETGMQCMHETDRSL